MIKMFLAAALAALSIAAAVPAAAQTWSVGAANAYELLLPDDQPGQGVPVTVVSFNAKPKSLTYTTSRGKSYTVETPEPCPYLVSVQSDGATELPAVFKMGYNGKPCDKALLAAGWRVEQRWEKFERWALVDGTGNLIGLVATRPNGNAGYVTLRTFDSVESAQQAAARFMAERARVARETGLDLGSEKPVAIRFTGRTSGPSEYYLNVDTDRRVSIADPALP